MTIMVKLILGWQNVKLKKKYPVKWFIITKTQHPNLDY
jgi:hypothetical protein